MSETEETKKCTNCNLDILCSNYTIHSVHCQRNFYLCTECKLPVNYNDKISHEEEYHALVYCMNCHIEIKKWKLDSHRVNDCPYRKMKCQICDIEVKATDLTEHENYCGSRTEKCVECGEFVMLRYKSLHIDSNHTFIKLSDEPGPSPSWQYGKRTLYNFMPDLNSKSPKPVSSHKRRSAEGRRSRNSESESNKSDDLPNKNEIEANKPTTNDFSKIKARKSYRKDCEDWPSVSNFKSLQISEGKQDNTTDQKEPNDIFKIKSRKSFRRDSDDWSSSSNFNSFQTHESKKDNKAFQAESNEESDFMYAIKVSQELNSHIWEKDRSSEESKIFNNQFEPTATNTNSNLKNFDKSMFATQNKKEDLSQRKRRDSDNSLHNEEPIKLPCEFCGALIAAHNLLFHQNRCSFLMRDTFVGRDNRNNFSLYGDDIDSKILCGICNKFFKLSVFDSHQLHCQITPKFSKNDKSTQSRNIKSMNVKSEPGLQNGIEHSSPRLSRMGTRSEWLSELSKNSSGKDTSFKNINQPETTVPKTTKVSRKNRRAPSPPKM